MSIVKRIISASILIILLSSLKADEDFFVGKIVYEYSFTDLEGEDITEKLAPYYGREQHYYVDLKNYKAYDENNNWVQLYHGDTNSYFYFSKDKTAQKFNASMSTAQKIVVTRLDKKEKVCGYDCEVIQIETENTTVVYYFNPSIKVDAKVYANHKIGEWHKYMETTEGALPLKFVMTNPKNGFVWTSVATEVSRQALSAGHFKFPDDVLLSN